MASQELQEEFEALKWTYGDDVRIEHEANQCASTTIHAKLYPNTGEREEQRFVEAELVLTGFDSNYPDSAPALGLKDARGLGDERERQLQAELVRQMESLLGTMMIGSIIEAGRDFLTNMNHPQGHCAFCLEEMASSSQYGESQHGESLVKLPYCYHAFHKDCFVEWWAWRQHTLMEKEKALVAHAGISAPEFILRDQLPAKEEHEVWQAAVFCTLCPCCRAAAPLSSLRHLDKDLRSALRALLYPSSNGSSTAHLDGVREDADPGAVAMSVGVNVEAMAELQAQHRRIFEKQLAAGAIIPEGGATSCQTKSLHSAWLRGGCSGAEPAVAAVDRCATNGTATSSHAAVYGQMEAGAIRGQHRGRGQRQQHPQQRRQEPDAYAACVQPALRVHAGGPMLLQQQQQQQSQNSCILQDCLPDQQARRGRGGRRGGRARGRSGEGRSSSLQS